MPPKFSINFLRSVRDVFSIRPVRIRSLSMSGSLCKSLLLRDGLLSRLICIPDSSSRLIRLFLLSEFVHFFSSEMIFSPKPEMLLSSFWLRD